MKRKYTAIVDNGRDTFEFNYTSNRRNHTHGNLKDCMMQLLRDKGHHAGIYRIVETFRNNWEN